METVQTGRKSQLVPLSARGGRREGGRRGEEEGGGLSWQQSCPGNSSVPMVTPPKFPGEERGNQDKNMAPVLVFSCRKLPLSLSPCRTAGRQPQIH